MATANIWPTTSVGLLNQLNNLGDSEAWGRFYLAYRPLVDRIGRRRGLQPVDVDEVTQQVLFNVSRSISNFEYGPERGRFRGWLATITARCIARQWQLLKRQTLTDVIDESYLDTAHDSDCVGEFYEALLESAQDTVRMNVERREWDAFELISRGDVPVNQIATQFNRSVSWVYRTKNKLMNLMTEEVQRLSDDVSFIHR